MKKYTLIRSSVFLWKKYAQVYFLKKKYALVYFLKKKNAQVYFSVYKRT